VTTNGTRVDWGRLVRNERKRRRIPVRVAALEMGLSHRTVENWERPGASEPVMRNRRLILEWLKREGDLPPFEPRFYVEQGPRGYLSINTQSARPGVTLSIYDSADDGEVARFRSEDSGEEWAQRKADEECARLNEREWLLDLSDEAA